MHVWNLLHAACWKYRTQKWRQKSPSGHHRATLSDCIFASKAHIDNQKKNLLSSNMSSTCPHNMVNFGPLAAEICCRVWDTPANFNGFRVLAALLQWRRSAEANQTLHDVWPCPALLHYIYIFPGAVAPWQNFAQCKIHFTFKSCVLLYCQRYCMALQQRASAKLYGVVQGMELPNFRRGGHLYSAGRPSRWASAHIIVKEYFSRRYIDTDMTLHLTVRGTGDTACRQQHEWWPSTLWWQWAGKRQRSWDTCIQCLPRLFTVAHVWLQR